MNQPIIIHPPELEVINCCNKPIYIEAFTFGYPKFKKGFPFYHYPFYGSPFFGMPGFHPGFPLSPAGLGAF